MRRRKQRTIIEPLQGRCLLVALGQRTNELIATST
jgi:hypothetical protein|tara:strand:- start:1910 stop:2014 length:105 start_codon:yes stop_codon:yes gene_type:complete